MSKHEIKCQNCGQWTPGDRQNCTHCGALVDPQEIDSQERSDRAEKHRKEREAAETRFEKFLKRLRHSNNPFARFSYSFLNVIWMIYMAIISFIIWFTAIFSG